VVLKPAEFTPLTAILFAEVCERAGVPKASSTSSRGGPEAGAAIVNHPGIQKIAFTGPPRSARSSAKPQPDPARSYRWNSAAVGLRRLRGRRSRQRRRRLVDGIWFSQR
jgi:aldehyde dehydrogenase (NAD+)